MDYEVTPCPKHVLPIRCLSQARKRCEVSRFWGRSALWEFFDSKYTKRALIAKFTHCFFFKQVISFCCFPHDFEYLGAGWSAAPLQTSTGISLRESKCPKAGIAKAAPPGHHARRRGSASPRPSLSPSRIWYFPSAAQNAGRREKELSPASRDGKSTAATEERVSFPGASFSLGKPGKPG